jgi:hypothetical protein
MCQCLEAGQWFSLSIPVSFPNTTDHHDITEILLKVAFNSDHDCPFITLSSIESNVPQVGITLTDVTMTAGTECISR